MAESRSRLLWSHTSTVLAMLANVNRDPKRRKNPYVPSDFDPTRPQNKKDRIISGRRSWSILKREFGAA